MKCPINENIKIYICKYIFCLWFFRHRWASRRSSFTVQLYNFFFQFCMFLVVIREGFLWTYLLGGKCTICLTLKRGKRKFIPITLIFRDYTISFSGYHSCRPLIDPELCHISFLSVMHFLQLKAEVTNGVGLLFCLLLRFDLFYSILSDFILFRLLSFYLNSYKPSILAI